MVINYALGWWVRGRRNGRRWLQSFGTNYHNTLPLYVRLVACTRENEHVYTGMKGYAQILLETTSEVLCNKLLLSKHVLHKHWYQETCTLVVQSLSFREKFRVMKYWCGQVWFNGNSPTTCTSGITSENIVAVNLDTLITYLRFKPRLRDWNNVKLRFKIVPNS